MTNDVEFPLCRELITGALLENSIPHRELATAEAVRILREADRDKLIAAFVKTELDMQMMYDLAEDTDSVSLHAYVRAVGFDLSAGDEDMDGFEPMHGSAAIPQSAIELIEKLVF